MDKINDRINELLAAKVGSTPLFFDLGKPADADRLDGLFAEGGIRRVSDDYKEQLLELYGVNNPSLVYAPGFKEKFEEHYAGLEKEQEVMKRGNWVYFPWSSTLVHILPEADFQSVRTARNKNLINADEQSKFYNSTIGIAGLSVGSSVALAIAMGGGAKRLKLADMDKLALSNTNRILTGVDNLGVPKVELAARKIYEINPYAQVELFPDGLTKDSIGSFFEGLDVVIDEIDSLAFKYLIRVEAKKRGIAVVMAADNGDNAVVDIERYDLDAATPFFHGRMGDDVSFEMLSGLDKFGIGKMITKHVGPENVTERMQQSLMEMGKTIVSWPQLGGAALVNGAAVAYCVRKILNDQPLETNRALVSMDEKLVPGFSSPEQVAHRSQISEAFKKIFGL
jgi:tRNA threonylcarbamoyladenosine dehydratase